MGLCVCVCDRVRSDRINTVVSVLARGSSVSALCHVLVNLQRSARLSSNIHTDLQDSDV